MYLLDQYGLLLQIEDDTYKLNLVRTPGPVYSPREVTMLCDTSNADPVLKDLKNKSSGTRAGNGHSLQSHGLSLSPWEREEGELPAKPNTAGVALEQMPAAEQGMLDLGHRRQFWSQVLFQQVFNRTARSLRENRSKILETNTKALRHAAIFQMFLNGSNPPKSRVSPIASSTLGQPELLSCLLRHHSSLQPLCVSNSTWRLCCAVCFPNGATGHRSYCFQEPPELFAWSFKTRWWTALESSWIC